MSQSSDHSVYRAENNPYTQKIAKLKTDLKWRNRFIGGMLFVASIGAYMMYATLQYYRHVIQAQTAEIQHLRSDQPRQTIDASTASEWCPVQETRCTLEHVVAPSERQLTMFCAFRTEDATCVIWVQEMLPDFQPPPEKPRWRIVNVCQEPYAAPDASP